ncbi:MAG: methyltransferase domain-containing protein [Pseudomonadales bacterium]|nr:class I SAM-dependent methyltransferase [Pseudomonadales bacterium]
MIVRVDSNTQKLTTTVLLLIALCSIGFTPDQARADAIDDAVADPARPDADRERDTTSLPAETLRFFGVPKDGVVLDLFAGGGYFSEIVSRAIGADGTVYLHNNQAYLGFAGDALNERLRGNRLPNVIRYDREIDAIDLPDDSVDLVLMVMTYHDFYYRTDGWQIDPEQAFAMLHRVLKPGGVLAIIDHVAKAGSGSAAAQELHRIDPEFARRDIEAHGFVFDGASTLLENSADPLDVGVFDPAIRSHTSRFMYRFIEP